MSRIGFIGSVSREWMGGLNYFNNLLFALNFIEYKRFELVVFVGKQIDAEIKEMFGRYANVVEDDFFDRKSVKWFLMKAEQKIFRTNFLLSLLLRKHKIDILSHASMINLKNIKTINWIPDFQHKHLPQMFSKKEILERNQRFLEIAKGSDVVILSSYDTLKDFREFTPEYEHKARVLQFVSQPHKTYFELEEKDKNDLLKKYNIENDFFYMPNQFWKHKNHMLAFEAIDRLKSEGVEICLVCTGCFDDYRNREYIQDIKDFIKKNSLEKQIKILGLIAPRDVFALIKFSKAVINPSLFEGWSSTVEECKSVGKNMILSNLDVHKEQCPEATFFERNSVNSLRDVLRSYDKANKENINTRSILMKRTEKFATAYIRIVEEIFPQKSN